MPIESKKEIEKRMAEYTKDILPLIQEFSPSLDGHRIASLLASGLDSLDGHGDESVQKGVSYLHRAAYAGDNTSIASLLASRAFSINAQVATGARTGKTALFLASEGDHLLTVEWLIKQGAVLDLETSNPNGGIFKCQTAASIAAYCGHEKVLRALVAAGASLRKSDGACFAKIALEQNHEGCSRIIEFYEQLNSLRSCLLSQPLNHQTILGHIQSCVNEKNVDCLLDQSNKLQKMGVVVDGKDNQELILKAALFATHVPLSDGLQRHSEAERDERYFSALFSLAGLTEKAIQELAPKSNGAQISARKSLIAFAGMRRPAAQFYYAIALYSGLWGIEVNRDLGMVLLLESESVASAKNIIENPAVKENTQLAKEILLHCLNNCEEWEQPSILCKLVELCCCVKEFEQLAKYFRDSLNREDYMATHRLQAFLNTSERFSLEVAEKFIVCLAGQNSVNRRKFQDCYDNIFKDKDIDKTERFSRLFYQLYAFSPHAGLEFLTLLIHHHQNPTAPLIDEAKYQKALREFERVIDEEEYKQEFHSILAAEESALAAEKLAKVDDDSARWDFFNPDANRKGKKSTLGYWTEENRKKLPNAYWRI